MGVKGKIVKVHFLGCGDAFGSGGQLQTCFLVSTAQDSFIVDCGASTLIALKAARISPNDITKIFITHLHGDHFGGIPFFILDAQLVSKRTQPLTIVGPPCLEERVYSAMEIFFPRSSQVKRKFEIRFLELMPRQPQEVDGVLTTAFPVIHFSGAPSYALRLECDGSCIVYSGDTEWTETLLEAAAGADLFICEAYYYEKLMKFHLDYKSLLSHFPEFSCKRIVLTHMNDDLLSRLEQVELETARDGMILTI
jgi:ribonuclease BN (tRNA processing enzyme)